MKTIPELINSYKEHLTIVNRSPRTIKLHLWRLKRFISFLDAYSITDVQDITQDYIMEYQKHCHYRENRYKRQDSISVQNHHLASIKCFFHWLKQEGYISNNSAEEIEYAKEPKRLPQTALTNKEVKQILRQPDTGTLEGYRDRTILEVLYSTGIRKSELINIKTEDIDYEQGYLRINQGKGNKDRVVPLGKIASEHTENYIKGIRPWLNKRKETKELFISRKGNKLGKSTLDGIIKKYARLSKLEKPISTHTFRRSCATEMIKNKANLMHVKELLGHNSMETVQAYCNLSIVDLKEAHKKHHPREKDEK